MALATSNRDGGRTNEAGHLRSVTKGFVGDVFRGLLVSQRAAGANMSVDISVGDALIRRSDDSYAHPAWNDAVYNLVIPTADATNPRNDLIVMYIDYGEAPTTAVSNNTNGVVKIKVVSGAAAGSPADPTASAIQSSVGAGNPYTILGRVRLLAGATSVGNSSIDDLRSMASPKEVPGTVKDNAGSKLPAGYLWAAGQAVSRATYADLFAALGTLYGAGDGSTTFNVPDYRGRVIAGKDDMNGTSANRLTGLSGGLNGDTLGATGGAETHTLTLSQVPNVTGGIGLHSGERGSSFTSGSGVFAGSTTAAGYIAPNGTNSASSSIYNNINFSHGGGGGAHNNVQPTAIANKVIAY